MAQDLLLESTAFGFIRVAPRPSKPRQAGLTIMADRGFGMHHVEDVLETCGQYIDFIKLGKGSHRLQSEDFVRRKIAAYRQAEAEVFFAGDVSEAAFLQGVSRQYFRKVKELGAVGVEISSAQVAMSLSDKCELIRMAAGEGLRAVAEVGQKGQESWTDAEKTVVAQVRAYQKAGAWKLLLQGEGVSEDVEEIKGDFILKVTSDFDINDFIFQAKNTAAQKWYVSMLGNQVNVDVYDDQVIDMELMRRGIRKRGLFGLVGSLGQN
ncbi:MAG: phosphosulfolactate synthase [Betaproteobacteria bacterium]|nr:phosphosulfolactate synthase [Betaproteobacteria bacterium]